ncbi:MAG TPA: C40 family peptidase, partial [Epulopiscium sp.]|nr:C40 family peptidase [Candidatus Epulonipiscium sp.]
MKIRKMGILLAGIVGSLLIGNNVYAESYAAVNVEALNVRNSPSIKAAVLDSYGKKETVKVLDQISPEWYVVESKEGYTAYVDAQYVDVFKVKAKINANGVNSRTYPTLNSKVNRQFHKGESISVHYQVGDWYYISLPTESFFGFVHQSYIEDPFLYLVSTKDISEVKEVSLKETPKSDPKTTKAHEVIDYVKRFIGNPYRYGGNSLTRGIDCSGFTQQVMKKAGVSLQRSSAAQYARNGVKVSRNNLQAGDLL